MVATSWSPEADMARAVDSFAGVHTVGRPPVLPLALAAASPAMVRSRISSRSNWASAPNTWNVSRPVGVEVSICSPRLTKGDLAALQLADDVDQVTE